MATVEIELRKYVRKNGTSPLVLRITAGNQVSRKNTGLYIMPVEWDERKRRVNRKHPQWTRINDALEALCKEAEGIKADSIKERIPVSPSNVNKAIFATHDFYIHADNYIKSLTGDTEWRTQKNLQSTLNHLKLFCPELSIESISADLISNFRKYLEALPRSKRDERPISRTTVLKRLVNFRSLYNKSPNKRNPSPFKDIVIGVSRPAKIEPLTEEELQLLDDYAPRSPQEKLARDMFMFSYYALGMRIGDVIMMKWDYVKAKRIEYEQTKKLHLDREALSIPRHKYLDEILERWPRKSEYVFNTITKTEPRNILKEVEVIQASINRTLKAIALHLKIDKWIAGKVARKTLSFLANEKMLHNPYKIQMVLDHSHIRTTEGYTGRDLRVIDEVAKATYGY